MEDDSLDFLAAMEGEESDDKSDDSDESDKDEPTCEYYRDGGAKPQCGRPAEFKTVPGPDVDYWSERDSFFICKQCIPLMRRHTDAAHIQVKRIR